MSNYHNERLEKLLQQEAQLKARIQQAKARMRSQDDKVRTGRLIAWGVVIEQKLAQGDITAEGWALECQKALNGRTLERALTGPLDGFTPEGSIQAESGSAN
jgi:hypothetical protein